MFYKTLFQRTQCFARVISAHSMFCKSYFSALNVLQDPTGLQRFSTRYQEPENEDKNDSKGLSVNEGAWIFIIITLIVSAIAFCIKNICINCRPYYQPPSSVPRRQNDENQTKPAKEEQVPLNDLND